MILLATIVVTVLILYQMKIIGHKKIVNDIKNISLVYRNSNLAYDKRDNLYVFEENGTAYYRNMNETNQKDTTLINIILDTISEENFMIGTIEPIPITIIEDIYSVDLHNMKYKQQQGAFDAPSNIYYVLIERNSAIELVKLSEYGSRNITNKSLDMEEIFNYIKDNTKGSKMIS